MTQSATPDIAAGRLRPDEIAANFEDIKPPLDRKKALIESSRCYFCHDAPCIEACPTSIDIPNFVRMINTGNTLGAAETILEANILGGMCARVCPTEILCEDKCVRNTSEDKPVNIGMLQRYAVDHLMAQGRHPFARQAPTGKRIAVVGGGPAGQARTATCWCACRAAGSSTSASPPERHALVGRALPALDAAAAVVGALEGDRHRQRAARRRHGRRARDPHRHRQGEGMGGATGRLVDADILTNTAA